MTRHTETPMTAPTKLQALGKCRVCGSDPKEPWPDAADDWIVECSFCAVEVHAANPLSACTAWGYADSGTTPPIAAPADAEREELAEWCNGQANHWIGEHGERGEAHRRYRRIAALLRTPAPEPPPAGEVLEPGVAEIAAERRRQREVEGWTDEHDDEHARGEIAQAAACYAVPEKMLRRFRPSGKPVIPPPNALTWPWDEAWWKPKNRLRDLERAGALIAAEIARIKRKAPHQ